MDYVCPKHKIQTVRSIWQAEHGHRANSQGLIPCRSRKICKKTSNHWYKKVYLTQIVGLPNNYFDSSLSFFITLFLMALFWCVYPKKSRKSARFSAIFFVIPQTRLSPREGPRKNSTEPIFRGCIQTCPRELVNLRLNSRVNMRPSPTWLIGMLRGGPCELNHMAWKKKCSSWARVTMSGSGHPDWSTSNVSNVN